VAEETWAYPDPDALAEAAGTFARDEIRQAVTARGRAVVVLAGGSTPRETYRCLTREITENDVPTDRLWWLFGDERWVPLDDPRSNERMAREYLLGPIGAPSSTVISWEAGRGEPEDCAAGYAERARSVLQGGRPDLVFLGMGADGHTASLFPDGVVHLPSGILKVGRDMPGTAAAVYSESANGYRLTLCPALLNTARTVVFLVAGGEKAAALKKARTRDPATPASWIRGERTLFLVTRGALGPEAADFGREVRNA